MGNRPWTKDEERILIEMFPHYTAKEIQEKIHRGKGGIYTHAALLGLRSTPEKLSRVGKTYGGSSPKFKEAQFSKGHIPDNKGKKMPKSTYDKVRRTMFHKGQPPKNYKPVGSERTDKEGYRWRKVADPNKWRLIHRMVWEEANGPIPPGHNIQFRDHNPQNCALDNLYIITKAEQLKTQNSFMAKYPKELQDVIRLKGALKRRIKQHKPLYDEK